MLATRKQVRVLPMEQKKTMFQYLHNSLVQQITSGQIAYGEQLPTLRTLCGLYNVGIRTVRDVITAMAAEGYVKTVPGSHVRASYQLQGDRAQLAEIELSGKDALLALLKTMEHIMPHLYAEAVKFCDDELIRACRKDVAGIDGMSTKNQWRKARIALQRIIGAYRNNLLDDLCIDMDLSAQVAIVPGFENPYGEMSVGAEAGFNRLFDKIASQDCAGVSAIIRDMYRDAAQAITVYFDAIKAEYPAAEPEQIPYRWNAEKGRSHTYMKVTRDVIKRIYAGEYPDGSVLPSSSQLCADYHITPYIAFNVMETLERIKLVKKGNGRRNYVITCSQASTKVLFADGPTPVADAMTFLGAVHVLSLISTGVAELGFDCMTIDDMDAIARHIQVREPLNMLNSILLALVRAQPYQPLKAICTELFSLVEWGYYFAFAYKSEEAHFLVIQQKYEEAIRSFRAGDKGAFAGAIHDIYEFAFSLIKAMLSKAGIAAAQWVG